MHTEIGFTPDSHMVSRISFRLSDITVVKPETANKIIFKNEDIQMI